MFSKIADFNLLIVMLVLIPFLFLNKCKSKSQEKVELYISSNANIVDSTGKIKSIEFVKGGEIGTFKDVAIYEYKVLGNFEEQIIRISMKKNDKLWYIDTMIFLD